MLECDFNKVAKALVFSCKFASYFKNTFFQEHVWVTAVKPLKQLYHTAIPNFKDLRKLIKKVKVIFSSHSELIRLVLSFWSSSDITDAYQVFSQISKA